MIPPAYPCVASKYVKKVIKKCEWVKNEKSALNLLCIVPRPVNDKYLPSTLNPYPYPSHTAKNHLIIINR